MQTNAHLHAAFHMLSNDVAARIQSSATNAKLNGTVPLGTNAPMDIS